MTVHTHPQQCLENLTPEDAHGGRWEYLEQEERFTRKETEFPTGDCAVVALVHAMFRPPTGQSYRDTMHELSWSIRPWMFNIRKVNERKSGYLIRRVKQWLKPPEHNPIHMTPSHATAERLEFLGYQHIYPNDHWRWHCICDMECTYVLDVQLPLGDHTLTVHQRIAYTTAFFEPEHTVVGNVFRLSPGRTREFKAWGQYREAERSWFQEFIGNDYSRDLDWLSRRPKSGDFSGK